jgi:two-component system chemotaxis response regulator CheB
MNAIVMIAGSAGSLEPLRRIITALPVRCTAPVFAVMHIGRNPSVLPSLLGRTAAYAQDGVLIEAGHIYVAPPDHHMLLEPDRIRLSQGPKVHFTRPAADPLFVSAAAAHRERVIGIVLSGGGWDGAAGLRAIKDHGGTTLVQHPKDALMPWMPYAAIATANPDYCLPIQELAQRVGEFCSRPDSSV